MNPVNKENSKAVNIFFITALSIICLLIAVIIAGTIFGLIRPPGAPPVIQLGNERETLPAAWMSVQDESDMRIFSGIGRMRIPLANSSTMILSVAFPYPASDAAFSQELAARIGDFRSIALEYFSSLPQYSIVNINEENAKNEILRRYNNILRLGRIETLFFSDMMIIDSIPD